MKDFVYVGSAPSEETPEQMGYDVGGSLGVNYVECEALRRQMIRIIGEPLAGAKYRIKREVGGGGHYELVCEFDHDKPDSFAYAFNAENNLPRVWDRESIQWLLNNPRIIESPSALKKYQDLMRRIDE